MRILALQRAHLSAVAALLREQGPFDAFRASLVSEKLWGDPPGEESLALGVDGDGGLAAFVAIVARGATAWIKAGAVAAPARGRGCLRSLLAEAERWARARGARHVRLMDHPGNYWTPGLDVRHAEAMAALAHLGWAPVGENRNLACPTAPEGAPRPPPHGVEVRRAGAAQREELLALATRLHPAWAWEARRALTNRPAGVHVAIAGGAIVAFAAHDGNNKGTGAFGPAATTPEWRGRGLGELLLRACLRDIARGRARRPRRFATIPWVSETSLYERLGARVAGRYRVLRKELP